MKILFLLFLLFSIHQPVYADDIVDRINVVRKEQKATLVTPHSLLNVSATKKACDMYKRGYWSHTTPEGTPFYILISKSGYYYKISGENIIRNNTDPIIVVDKWLASPTHKKVMLDSRYKDIGIGRCGNIIVTHYAAK